MLKKTQSESRWARPKTILATKPLIKGSGFGAVIESATGLTVNLLVQTFVHELKTKRGIPGLDTITKLDMNIASNGRKHKGLTTEKPKSK